MENQTTTETPSFSNETLAEIRKSEGELIRIAKTEFKGGKYIDIRLFYEPKDGSAYLPTRKGLALKEDLFLAFAEAIRKVEQTISQNI